MKFNVYVTNDKYKEKEIEVFTALSPDGTGFHETDKDVLSEFDGGLTYSTTVEKTYYCNFESDTQSVVKVVFGEKIKNLKIKPASLKKEYTLIDDNTIEFKTECGEKIVLENNGDFIGSLKIFANNEYKNIFGEKTIVFDNGVYTSENCPHIRINSNGVPVIDNIFDGTTVFIGENAVVNAAIVLSGKKNIKIIGTGNLSLLNRCYGYENNFETKPVYGGFRNNALPSVFIKNGCDNITVDGVSLNCEFRGVVVRNSKNITLNNIKIFSSCVNSDGINNMNAEKVEVSDSFVSSGDDCLALFNACDSIEFLGDDEYKNPTGITKNISMHNCLLSTCARIFMVGGHATGSDSPHNTVEDVRIYDNEVINVLNRINGCGKDHRRYWSGILRVLSQSNQIVRNVSFKNINIDWTKGYDGKLIHIETRANDSASYSESGGYKIENISFENIHTFNADNEVMDSIIANNNSKNGSTVENISLKNVDLITKDNLEIIGDVEKVTFEN